MHSGSKLRRGALLCYTDEIRRVGFDVATRRIAYALPIILPFVQKNSALSEQYKKGF